MPSTCFSSLTLVVNWLAFFFYTVQVCLFCSFMTNHVLSTHTCSVCLHQRAINPTDGAWYSFFFFKSGFFPVCTVLHWLLPDCVLCPCHCKNPQNRFKDGIPFIVNNVIKIKCLCFHGCSVGYITKMLPEYSEKKACHIPGVSNLIRTFWHSLIEI